MDAPVEGSYRVEPGRLLAGRYVRDAEALLGADPTPFVDLIEGSGLEE